MADSERKKARKSEGESAAHGAETRQSQANGAEVSRGDAAHEEPRHGLPGKGFDAGTGYGGAGGSSAYSGESSYGGQAGYGGSTTRGAYSGGKFGRPDDPGGPFAGHGDAESERANDDDATGTSGGEGSESSR